MRFCANISRKPTFDPAFAQASYTVRLELEGPLAQYDPSTLKVSMMYEAGDCSELNSWVQDGYLYFITSPTTCYRDAEGTPYYDEAYIPRHMISGAAAA